MRGGDRVPPSETPFPAGVESHVVFGCAGPRPTGVCFCLRLSYLDETTEPGTLRQFDREWIVQRPELELAERRGRMEELLSRRRSREERAFLHEVERTLRQDGARLERRGDDLVLRRAAE